MIRVRLVGETPLKTGGVIRREGDVFEMPAEHAAPLLRVGRLALIKAPAPATPPPAGDAVAGTEDDKRAPAKPRGGKRG